MKNVDPVVSGLGTAVVNHISYQIVRGSLVVFVLHFLSQKISKLDVAQRKVDDRRILLHKKVVFGEPLDVENDVPGKNINK